MESEEEGDNNDLVSEISDSDEPVIFHSENSNGHILDSMCVGDSAHGLGAYTGETQHVF